LHVIDEPEDNRVHVHRDSIFRQGLLRTEGRGLNAFIDDGDHVVDDGAPKPDISTVEAFKRALLNARSIGYIAPNRVQDLIERLGLKNAIQPKVTVPTSDVVAELVAKGEIELGIVVTTQILTTAGVELVGPLPPEIQYQFQFAGGVSANPKAPAAARDLLKFLTGPSAVPVIKSQGMEPGQKVFCSGCASRRPVVASGIRPLCAVRPCSPPETQ
jgi:Bacterial extracellular solute-binding protein